MARRRGSSRDHGAAAIASSRRRASARWPRFCQKRHIEKASRIATGGSGRRDRPVEDGPDVVVLELEPVEPAPLVGAGQLGGGLLGERDEPVAMAAPG